MRRILAQRRTRSSASDRRASRSGRPLPAEQQPYKLELAEDLADGERDQPLHPGRVRATSAAGRTCRTPKPIKAFKLTLDSPAPTGAATREQADADAHLRHGLLHDQSDLEEHLSGSRRRAAATTAGWARELDLFHFSEVSPGSPFWHPQGMVIWNELTTLWRELNAQRGYREVRTPILYSIELWKRRGTGTSTARTCSSPRRTSASFGLKPMNCPGHVEIYDQHAAQLPRPAAAAGRAGAGAPQRALGRAARPDARASTSPRTTPTSSAREDQVEDEVIGCLELAAHHLQTSSA